MNKSSLIIKPATSFCAWCLKNFARNDQCVTHPTSGMSVHLLCARIIVEVVRQYDARAEMGSPAFAELERRVLANSQPIDPGTNTGRQPSEPALPAILQTSPTVLGSETAPGEAGSASKEKK